ncbi:tripartite tricarboxylate transporter substrate binding protein [Desulfosporosinus shakirovi]|uniref:tripartite tricarboxylate transporter substrate binding protein n=1 Tax=Desulfosporosinus shakirovi TaxID=2885154 RepID=UPI001E39921A|nr:tripartite tricarboxylate transporter substrate binding protein [Desulfosporosinus sp. SRJS8]MCB8816708.1 tripartite tricarboxylate transporter substrate binding protein [Desulfosporosinus sp. SRJS8]
MKMKKKMIWIIGILLLTVTVAGCSSQSTQGSSQTDKQEAAYPTKQIELVVPAGPGGLTDLTARLVADFVSKKWKQPVLVINKPGAGNVTGLQYGLIQGRPDGYTVVADNIAASVLMAAGMKNPPIKLEDRIFVSKFVDNPMCFSVAADSPFKDMKELVEWIKQNPEKLTHTSLSTTSMNALTAAELCKAIGVDYKKTQPVLVQSGSAGITMIAGGHAVLGDQSVQETYPLAAGGKLRVLAVASKERSLLFPDVPTCQELGINIDVTWYGGISVPKGTPDYIVKKWDQAIAEIEKDPEFINKMKEMHGNASYLNTADYNNSIKEQVEQYTELFDSMGVRQ